MINNENKIKLVDFGSARIFPAEVCSIPPIFRNEPLMNPCEWEEEPPIGKFITKFQIYSLEFFVAKLHSQFRVNIYPRTLEPQNTISKFYGTVEYAAPEINVLNCKSYNPELADSWSAALILTVLFYGQTPDMIFTRGKLRYVPRWFDHRRTPNGKPLSNEDFIIYRMENH